MATSPYKAMLNVRMTHEDEVAFRGKCNEVNRGYSDVVRELIRAFTSDRLLIKLTEEQKKQQEIYKK